MLIQGCLPHLQTTWTFWAEFLILRRICHLGWIWRFGLNCHPSLNPSTSAFFRCRPAASDEKMPRFRSYNVGYTPQKHRLFVKKYDFCNARQWLIISGKNTFNRVFFCLLWGQLCIIWKNVSTFTKCGGNWPLLEKS